MGPIITLAIMAALAYGAWRLLIFFRIALRPAKERYSVEIDIISKKRHDFGEHLAGSLRSAGLGPVADAGETISKMSDIAADKLTASMDKKEHDLKGKL